MPSPSTHRGLILQPTHRMRGGRPFVQLHGRLETGEPFLVETGTSRCDCPLGTDEGAQGEQEVHDVDVDPIAGGQ